MRAVLHLFLFVFISLNAVSQKANEITSFTIVGDNSVDYKKVYFGPYDVYKERFEGFIEHYYDSLHIVSIEVAAEVVKPKFDIHEVKLVFDGPNNPKHWIFICNYKKTRPNSFAGEGGYLYYTQIKVNARNGKLIEQTKIKEAWKY